MTNYDVLVVGGGAGGLSAAVTLARARRSVLVVDAGEPRNRAAAGVHGYLGLDGVSPAQLLATGRAELERYGAIIRTGEVVAISGSKDAFVAEVAGGERVAARRLLFATGLVDELPDVPGVRERWGRDVLHCPYCHGWEVRDRPLGVLATGPIAAHQALLTSQWSDDVVLFLDGLELADDYRAKLDQRSIEVIAGKVGSLAVEHDRLVAVELTDGSRIPRAALFVAPRFVARTTLLTSLGIDLLEHPLGMGEHAEAGPMGETSVPGVYVAGNVSYIFSQVVMAAAAGSRAAMAINGDLLGLYD